MAQRKRRSKNVPIGFINAFWGDILDQNTFSKLTLTLPPVGDPMFWGNIEATTLPFPLPILIDDLPRSLVKLNRKYFSFTS